jgi:hypothetical protein
VPNILYIQSRNMKMGKKNVLFISVSFLPRCTRMWTGLWGWSNDKEFHLLRYNATHFVEIQRRFEESIGYVAFLAACFMLVSCLVYSSTMELEATRSSETSVDFRRTRRRYIPEDRTIHNHRCENLISWFIPSNLQQDNVLAKVKLKSSIFWDVTPCSPLNVIRRFPGTCCLHFMG